MICEFNISIINWFINNLIFRYYESCLRSLRTIILSKDCLIENNIIDKISESIEMILEKIQISSCIEEYTCEIITTCCQVIFKFKMINLTSD